jgi:tripartite ATP-independent transporter DctM subunit
VITLLLIAALVAMLLGAPFFALIAGLTLVLLSLDGTDAGAFVINFAQLGEKQELVAVPLFALAGYLLGESRTPQRLVRLSRALFGWMPGGLAIVALIACALFTALTGASGVTIVALGAVLYPALITARYSQPFALGLVTSSGSLGMLFAPALPLIIYAVVVQQLPLPVPVSLDDLFRAGLLPGLFLIAVLSIWAIWNAPPRTAEEQRIDPREIVAALKDTAWELPLPFVVLGAIYSGRIAASEAAALTAIYVLVVLTVIRREVPFGSLTRIIREAMVLVGAILTILGVALALTDYLILADVPGQLFTFVNEHIDSRWVFLLALNFILLVFGMLLEGFPAIVILTPLILPIALEFGVDPVHFGILFLANLQIGLFLPPLGMNLFIASYRFGLPVQQVIRATLPFFVLMLLATLVITYVPWLSLVLLGR